MTAILIVVVGLLALSFPARAALDPSPPAQPVKLVFIHHSTGENLLRNDYGGLGRALKANRYFVSDSNYGWGPGAIGDRTDIPDWMEWFRSADTPAIMSALYAESGKHSEYARLAVDPGGPNEIVLFKSCFPNSSLEGAPDDPPSPDGWLTVGHAKWVYNEILTYFLQHPDRLFVVLTAPPVGDGTHAANARAFNQWLLNDWLADNQYPFRNVAVFDFYNVLTHGNAHHRFDPASGTIEHVIVPGHDTSAYSASEGDDHPSVDGSRKATAELVPLLNVYFNAWKSADVPRQATFYSDAPADGTVVEAWEHASAGGARDRRSAHIAVGDDALNRQSRGILSFSVTLPSNAVITAASLRIRCESIIGTSPFATHGRLVADIRKRWFGADASLAGGDFEAPATRLAVAVIPAVSGGGWRRVALPAEAIPAIRNLGTTQFRLRFDVGGNGDGKADAVRFYSGNAPEPDRPRLIVRYYTP